MRHLLQSTMVCFCVLLLCTSGVQAQKDETVSGDKAAEYLQNGEWENAVKAFEIVTAEQPNNLGAWFQMGFALHSMKQYDKAISAYKTVLEAGQTPLSPITMYNLGCAYALKDQSATALEWLNKAAEAGFNQIVQMKGDGDLASLRDNEKFAEVLKRVDKNARPCAYNEKARQLDFWIGNWNVYNQAGQLAGTNTIQNVLQDCVIHEEWSSPLTGFNGQSFSTYDPSIGQWRQTWVDNTGATFLFTGDIVDGAMVFERESEDPEGNITMTQMIIRPMEDGNVHQVGQNSVDGGKTWTTNYDMIYVPQEKDSSGG